MTDKQKAFEAWFCKDHPPAELQAGDPNKYSNSIVQMAWAAWQARALLTTKPKDITSITAYLHYAKKKPELRRIDFCERPNYLERAKGWITSELILAAKPQDSATGEPLCPICKARPIFSLDRRNAEWSGECKRCSVMHGSANSEAEAIKQWIAWQCTQSVYFDSKKPKDRATGEATGWPAGMLQDDCKGLSKWLAGKPDALRVFREQDSATGEPVALAFQHNRDFSETKCPHCDAKFYIERESAPVPKEPL